MPIRCGSGPDPGPVPSTRSLPFAMPLTQYPLPPSQPGSSPCAQRRMGQQDGSRAGGGGIGVVGEGEELREAEGDEKGAGVVKEATGQLGAARELEIDDLALGVADGEEAESPDDNLGAAR